MRKTLSVAILLSFVMGCTPIIVDAPPDVGVTLTSQFEPAPMKVEKRVWYVLYGLVPLTDNTTTDIIQKYGFKKVHVKSEQTFLDYLITVFLGTFTIATRTIVVEGSRE